MYPKYISDISSGDWLLRGTHAFPMEAARAGNMAGNLRTGSLLESPPLSSVLVKAVAYLAAWQKTQLCKRLEPVAVQPTDIYYT